MNDNCSFCGKSDEDVERLFRDPDDPICNECLDTCSALLTGNQVPGWLVTTSPQRCAYCGRRPSEGVRHCVHLRWHSPRICNLCVDTALEALASQVVEEQISNLVDGVDDEDGIGIDDEIEHTLLESAGGPPARLLRPDAVTFDFGGTVLRLVEFDKLAGVKRMFEICEVSNNRTEQDLLEFIDELDLQVQERREESLIEYPAVLRQRLIYDALGILFDVSQQEVELEFWKASMQYSVEPGITTVLDGLSARDVKIALLSNSAFSASALRFELQRHGLHDYFSEIIVSADYGFRKPHPLLFRSAHSLLGSTAARTWHVGNSRYYDVEGAIISGMGSIWYNPVGRQPQGPAPHETVDSWSSFQSIVERVFDRPESS